MVVGAETFFFDDWRQHQLLIKVTRIFNTYGPRIHPLNVTMRGNGKRTLQQPVFKVFTGVTLQAGDCLTHFIRMDGHGIDAEDRVFALVVPD
jgi:hypothetical protein